MTASAKRLHHLLLGLVTVAGCSSGQPVKNADDTAGWMIVTEYAGSLPYHWDVCLVGVEPDTGHRGRPTWRVTDPQSDQTHQIGRNEVPRTAQAGRGNIGAALCSLPLVVIPDESVVVAKKNPIAKIFDCYAGEECYSSRELALPDAQLTKAIKYAGAFEKFDSARKQQRAEYQHRFNTAASFDDFKSFSNDYKSHDPDHLISTLKSRLNDTIYQAYRHEYATASSPSADQLALTSGFLNRYEDIYDPDNLVPPTRELRNHLIDAAAAKAAEAERQQAETERQRRTKEMLDSFEFVIGMCDVSTRLAREGIEKERKIGAISGYVDKEKLHQYGQNIAQCDETVPETYQKYRQAGGSKSLEELKNNPTVRRIAEGMRHK